MRAVLGWTLGVLVGIVLLVLLVHVFISPINPKQSAPSGHFDSSCWACHFVSSSAAIKTE